MTPPHRTLHALRATGNSKTPEHGTRKMIIGRLGYLAPQERQRTMRMRRIPLAWRRGKFIVRWLPISIVKGSIVSESGLP